MFNTLKYAKQLQGVGVPTEQAETHIQILCEVMETNLATKHDIKELEYRLTIKIISIIALANGLAVTVSKLIG